MDKGRIIIIIGPLNQNQVDAETGAIIRTLTVEITREQVRNSDLCCAYEYDICMHVEIYTDIIINS